MKNKLIKIKMYLAAIRGRSEEMTNHFVGLLADVEKFFLSVDFCEPIFK